jgi:hypothetical protein
MVSGSISPPYSGYFSPFLHSTCSLSVSQKYLALPDGAGRFRRDFSGPALLRILLGIYNLSLRGCHPLSPSFPTCSSSLYKSTLQSYNPIAALTTMVWANPRSLATTCGITIVFSSSGYLDVSVLRVRLLSDNTSSMYWVVPFGNLRIKSYVPIPAAYRSLSRPSSPLRAKASPIRP